jgi:hypothetical protein
VCVKTSEVCYEGNKIEVVNRKRAYEEIITTLNEFLVA